MNDAPSAQLPFATVVLTAGYSRRMGAPKAFLHLDGEPLLCRIVRTAKSACAVETIVVVGAERSSHLVDRLGAEAVLAAAGMRATMVVGVPDGHPIDSLRSGLARISPGHALLLWPVDHPFAGTELVHALVTAWNGTPDRIVIPRVGAQWGHPVLFGPAVVEELRSPLADGGAHRVVGRDPARLVFIMSDDPWLSRDLDTPQDAEAAGVSLTSFKA